MSDQRIFDQLDLLERGARDLHPPYRPVPVPEPVYEDSRPEHDRDYEEEPEHAFIDQPMQLDSFDERLLLQPEYNSRHGQATLGRARLSFQPRSTSVQARDDLYTDDPVYDELQGRPISQHLDLPQYTYFNHSTSPQTSAQPSSPAFNASQRHPAVSRYESHHVNRHRDQDHHLTHRRKPDHHTDRFENDAFTEPERSLIHPEKRPNTFARKPDGNVPIVQGISLIPTSQLPDRFRAIFPYVLFNAVQSKCFPVVYNTNDNFVLSSPTGSGKTAILELAICRLINGNPNGSFKIVYQAPTKSLCAERQRDWQAKFGPLDLQCAELTGDTDNAQLRNVQHASIIITTPEKWDSMTRKWKDHQKLLQMVKLVLIDEVHILKEDRGPTLEAVVSRMKSVGSDVRFIALSATVPNSQDIATWLGKDAMNPGVPAPREKFGEEFRPVRLQKHVCGYSYSGNDFAFDKILGGKLPEVIAKYSQRKPIMVFCFTRKSCIDTSKLLAAWWSDKAPENRYWNAPRGRVAILDKDLRETVSSGVAFHHAGLSIEDRTAVEKGYHGGEIAVICCTSTLAVGVNLPCHMVIIKNTVAYTQASGAKEYSDLEVMQMLGRAGRPQFDDSAVAVIMTRLPNVATYEKMVSGSEVLESCLHTNLIEHLNAEIGLGTVTNLSSAKTWLAGTFLYVRIKDNPEHYKIEGDVPGSNLDERLENICRKGIVQLEENDLIKGAVNYRCTEFGDSMSRYYIQFQTMKALLGLPPKAKISEILSTLAQAAEFKEIRFRSGEKPIYRELNKNSSIKFPIPGQLDQAACKVSLIVQSVLGAVELPTEDNKHVIEYNTCKAIIWQHAHRLIRCIVDCQLYLDDATTARNALMLARSLGGQVWDDSPLHMKQLEGIGPVAVRKFVTAGIRSIAELESTEEYRIEQILSRNPPFGAQIQDRARSFPRLRISLKITGEPTVKKGEHVTVKVKANIGFINEKVPQTFHRRAVYVCLLADRSDGHKLHFARISAKKMEKGLDILFSADLTTPGQVIRGALMCDEIAGTQQTATLKPEIPSFSFPPARMLEEAQGNRVTTNKAPNIAKRRTSATGSGRAKSDGDEFGDASLDDEDLAVWASGFVHADGFDDNGTLLSTNRNSNGVLSSSTAEHYEPRQLPNGRWACNHKCKKCKHVCCENGLEKKPKPPKAKEQKKLAMTKSDPKQTQLDLTQSKNTMRPTDQLSSSTAAPRKADTSKEIRNINRLHDSVKTSTRNMPLLGTSATSRSKDRRIADATNRRNHDPEEDYGVDTLFSDDFPTDPELLSAAPASHMNRPRQDYEAQNHEVDEMLDDLGNDELGRHTRAERQVDQDRVDISSFIDKCRPGTQQDETVDGGGGMSPPTSLEHALAPLPPPKQKNIFVTGSSTDSIDAAAIPDAFSSTIAPKHKLDDTESLFGRQMKKSRRATASRTPSRELHNGLSQSTIINQEKGFLTEAAGITVPREQANLEEREDLKTWFENEFGTELFTFVEK